MAEYDYLYKLLLVGDSGVGKSAILTRYADGSFRSQFLATIGVDSKIKTENVDDRIVKLQVWDAAGQERFRTIRSAYYGGSMGTFVVFNTSEEETFDHVKNWFKEVRDYSQSVVFLIAHKFDDGVENKAVSPERGKELANELGCQYFEVNAKTNENIDLIFKEMTKAIKRKVSGVSVSHESVFSVSEVIPELNAKSVFATLLMLKQKADKRSGQKSEDRSEQKVEEEEEDDSWLTCEVCCEKYDDTSRAPRLLLCGHTFCQECLEALNVGSVIKCPNKDGDTKLGKDGVNGLKRNYALQKLIVPVTTEKIICANDCVTFATKFCEDCGHSFCNSCCAQIHSIFIHRSHTICESPGKKKHADKKLFCDRHPNKEFELYCSTDQECICYECAYSIHKGHDISTVTDIASDRKQLLREKIASLKKEENRLHEIAQKLTSDDKQLQKNDFAAIEKINAIYGALKERISESERSYLEKVHVVTAKHDASLQQSRESIAIHISEISASITTLKHTLASPTEVEFVAKCAKILEDLSKHEKQFMDVSYESKDVSVSVSSSTEVLQDITQLLSSTLGINSTPKPVDKKVFEDEVRNATWGHYTREQQTFRFVVGHSRPVVRVAATGD